VGISVLSCGGIVMKKYLALLMFLSLAQWGCAFLGGAATGALATGAGYEINSKRQMDKLEDDYKNERISRREYEERKKQIESGSIIY
jgi:biopolymer transport protein ExbB/TolQ